MKKVRKSRGGEDQAVVFEKYARGASIAEETRAAELAIAMDALKGLGNGVGSALNASITERRR